ncbi:unnamed protein product [Symbiodinium sp. CCMP2456]|nr:unnamed protein product [Symbiodinium sp. CCMP2456]
MPPMATKLADIPQDVAALVCHYLNPEDALRLLPASRNVQSITQQPDIWRCFCFLRWGRGANLHLYENAKDCLRDQNGWFPWQGTVRSAPCFEVRRLKTHQQGCASMDLRTTTQELVTVSEALRHKNARLQILDPVSTTRKANLEVSPSNINCCDVARGLVCAGSDDGHVRVYKRGTLRTEEDEYSLVQQFACHEKVNDLRITTDGKVLALKTRRNRVPSGLDIIDLEYAGQSVVEGGSRASRGKFLHAVDGFDGGCSLHQVPMVGEHPLSTSFSAMLFDFRRSDACVLDVPVTDEGGMVLWPLRAGRFPQVFCGLVPESSSLAGPQGLISMVDFRYAAAMVPAIHLPGPVDDFRFLDGSIYAICSDLNTRPSPLTLHRYSPEAGRAEYLCTVVESCTGRRSEWDIKVLGIHPGGFAVAFGDELAVGTVARPPGWTA